MALEGERRVSAAVLVIHMIILHYQVKLLSCKGAEWQKYEIIVLYLMWPKRAIFTKAPFVKWSHNIC